MPKKMRRSQKPKKGNKKKGDKESKNSKEAPGSGARTKKITPKKKKTSSPQPQEMEQEAKTTLRLQTTQKERGFYQKNVRRRKESPSTKQEREDQIIPEIKRDTLSRYGFVPDLELSTFKNVYNIIGNMRCSHYFSRPNKLAFHDLTKKKYVPLVAREILDLSTKFIPTKSFTSNADELEKSQDSFRRDVHLKGGYFFWEVHLPYKILHQINFWVLLPLGHKTGP